MRISIMGDSISTYEGCNPEGYNVFYVGENAKSNGLQTEDLTWWKQVITYLGSECMVNNSYSGSMVTGTVFPAACTDRRVYGLGNPEMILVYIGFNDFGNGIATGDFFTNYTKMIQKMKNAYPDAVICCGTLARTYIKDSKWEFPEYYNSEYSFTSYNDCIREICSNEKVNCIDLERMQGIYETLDGTHPTAHGHKQLAELWNAKLTEIRQSIAESSENNIAGIPDKFYELGKIEAIDQGIYKIYGDKTYMLETIKHLDVPSVLKEFESRINIVKEFEQYKCITYVYDYEIQDKGSEKIAFLLEEDIIPLRKYLRDRCYDRSIGIKMLAQLCDKLKEFRSVMIYDYNLHIDDIYVTNNKEIQFNLMGGLQQTEKSEYRMLEYMAPEVYRGNAWNECADVYFVGLVLYSLFNDGQLPFEDYSKDNKEVMIYKRMAGTAFPYRMDTRFKGFIEAENCINHACEFEKKDRTKSLKKLKKELETIYTIMRPKKEKIYIKRRR